MADDRDFADEEITRPILPETLCEIAEQWTGDLAREADHRLCGRSTVIDESRCGDDVHAALRGDLATWERLLHVALIPSGESAPGACALMDVRRCSRCGQIIAKPIGPRNPGGRMR